MKQTFIESFKNAEGRGFESPVGSIKGLKNRHLLLPWLTFTI